MNNKVKISFSRNFGTENYAMTVEDATLEQLPEIELKWREAVLRQYESVLLTAIPEAAISEKHMVERTEALKKQNEALKALNDEAEKNAKEKARSNKLLKN